MKRNELVKRRFYYPIIGTKERKEQTNPDVGSSTNTNKEAKKVTNSVNSNPNNLYGDKKVANKKKNEVLQYNGLPPIQQVEKGVLKAVIGQNEQVRKILTAIYKANIFENLKSNLLIIGNSGTGKTETVKQIAKRLGIPYTIEDATKYTKEGYYGNDVEEMVYNLVRRANQNVSLAEHGIIIIDEIDKKAGYDSNDVSGVEVLKSLLKIIEGTTIQVPIEKEELEYDVVDFNTDKLTIILMGAFSGIDKIVDQRLNSKHLGFADTKKLDEQSKKKKILKQDLVKYGIPEEFVGRINTIVEMNELKEKELISILKNSNLSIFRRYQEELKKKGITLQYNRTIFGLIAKESLLLSTGARELTNTVNYIFENIMYDVIANPGKFTKCKLLLDIVKDNTKYELN